MGGVERYPYSATRGSAGVAAAEYDGPSATLAELTATCPPRLSECPAGIFSRAPGMLRLPRVLCGTRCSSEQLMRGSLCHTHTGETAQACCMWYARPRRSSHLAQQGALRCGDRVGIGGAGAAPPIFGPEELRAHLEQPFTVACRGGLCGRKGEAIARGGRSEGHGVGREEELDVVVDGGAE